MAYEPTFGTSGDIDGVSGGLDDIAATGSFLGGRIDIGGGDSGDGSGDNSGDGFDPDIHQGRDKRNADGSYTRKRKRRSNSATGGGRKKADNQAGIDGLTRMLAIIHLGISSVTKTPELKLDDQEAEALAKSTAAVLEEFDIRPDPKIEAIIGLITTAGMIYGPRVYMISERKKSEAVERVRQNEEFR